MQSLEKIGLNGMVSCQLTRVAFPTNLPMQIMADVLWDKNCDFEKKSAEYYAAAFGADGGAVSDYLKSLSEAFDPAYHRYYYWEAKPLYPAEERLEKLGRVESILDTFAPVIKKNLEADHCPGVKASWEYLSVHAEYCRMLVKPLISKANDNLEERNVLNEELNEFVRHLPERVHKIFDEWMAFTLTERMTKMDY